jgi:hypothetical protein
MSLLPIRGSIQNPAQAAVDFNGNNLTNVNEAKASTITIVNGTDLQTLSFGTTGATGGATGTISYVPSDLRFTCSEKFDVIGTASVGGNFQALSTMSVGGTATFSADIEYGIYNISGSGDVISGNCRTQQSIITGATGNDAIIQMLVADDPFPTSDEIGTVFFNKDAGFSFTNPSSDTTFNIGVGGTGGATGGALVYVRGNNGNGRVYDEVYNKVPTQSYASFSSSADQAIGSTAASQIITYNTTDVASADITRGATGNEGRITCAKAGVYKVLTSVQFTKSSSSAAAAYVWFSVNGTNVANSSSSITLAGNAANALATVEVILTLTANQYIEVRMAGESTDISAEHLAAETTPYARPANPSIITTVVRLSP